MGRARRFAYLPLVACLLALASAAQAAPGMPGSEAFGREFCLPAAIAAGDQGPPVGLAVERTTVRAGGTAIARVENRSEEQIEFGAEYHVQRFVQGRWRRAPGAPRGPWIQVALLLPPDRSGACVRYAVPDDAPPGRYRFSRDFGVGPGPHRPYYATFSVIP